MMNQVSNIKGGEKLEEFKKDFESEGFEKEDFAEVDALIEYLNNLPRNEVSILNYPRVQQLRFSCAMIKKVLRDTKCNAKVECKQHEFTPSVGVVRVEGMSLDIVDIEGFSRAAEFATNTEIYPLEANKVRLTFTFHGLLTPIK